MRLFIALALPARLREELGRLCSGLRNARWVRPENMHVTLRFVGAADKVQAADLDLALETVKAAPFELALSGVGTFGAGRKVRSVWAGVEKSPALARLQAKVETAVQRAGLGAEGRKYTPHVTLARFKNSPGPRMGGFLETRTGFAAGPISIDRFTLFESRLGHEGPHYEVLREYGLDG